MIKKKIARFIGRNIGSFKGKDKIIRFLYNPSKFGNIHMGEKFVTDYFGLKYEGITSNYIDWGVYFYEGLERGLIKYFFNEIQKNSFNYFIDIGANSGTLSLPFSKSNNLKIVCFEPLKYNFAKLINNYKINNLDKFHQFHQIALSNKKGVSNIYFSDVEDNIGTTSLTQDLKKNFLDTDVEKVNLDILDNLYNFKNKNIIIKIDVEGHEKLVIEGALNMVKNNHILMYIETLNKDLIQKLISLNFNVFFPKFYYNKYSFEKNQIDNHVILKNY